MIQWINFGLFVVGILWLLGTDIGHIVFMIIISLFVLIIVPMCLLYYIWKEWLKW